MKAFFLTTKSLQNRQFAAWLTVCSIAIGVLLLLGVERIRQSTRSGFEGTLSQTDLVVGARGAPLQILLYSVFHIGNPLNNVRYTSFEKYAAHSAVKWAVPLSLGDSHGGFRVIGTTKSFFENIKTGNKKSLSFREGRPFDGLFQVVIGADVAKKLRYSLGKKIFLSHGLDVTESFKHENAPFEVVGVLEATSTPFDKSLFVSLEAIEAIHDGWQSGAPSAKMSDSNELLKRQWKPQAITAFFIGLESRLGVFKIQSEINNDTNEPLTAFMPGITLRDLWNTLGKAEVAFKILGILVLVSNLLTLLLVLLSSLQERRREMAIYRSLGAGPYFMGKLLLWEALLLSVSGIVMGISVLAAFLYVAQSPLEKALGFPVPIWSLSPVEGVYLLSVLGGALLTALVPAFISYRQSLSDGLTVRL